MSVDQAFNYKQIDPLLSTAGVINESQLGELGSEGYEAVISLLPNDSEYAIANEPEIVTGQGIEYVYIPVDFAAPTQNDYHTFSTRLAGLAGKKTMIHCAANYRVSAFYAIYAAQNLGWNKEQARTLISSIWDVQEHPAWAGFVDKMLAQAATQ